MADARAALAALPAPGSVAVAVAVAVATVAPALVVTAGIHPVTTVERGPGFLADPHRPVSAQGPRNPIQHIVIVMQENHSFDEYRGMLPRNGQPAADGFTFDRLGNSINSNLLSGGKAQTGFHGTGMCPGNSAGQDRNDTHAEIDSGKMDDLAKIEPAALGYYTQADLPVYYALATQYTLASRWFASAPAQTYPNRRFLYAGTAYRRHHHRLESLLDAPPRPAPSRTR